MLSALDRVRERIERVVWPVRAQQQAEAARQQGQLEVAEAFEWAGQSRPWDQWEIAEMAKGNDLVRIKTKIREALEAQGFRVKTYRLPGGGWNAVAVTWNLEDPRRGIRWELQAHTEEAALERLSRELGQ